MQSLWPEDIIKVKTINTPKEILERQAQILESKTCKILYATLDNLTNSYNEASSDYNYDFYYEFSIRSHHLSNYKCELFELKHSIELYPLNIKVNNKIASDLGLEDTQFFVNNEGEFLDKLTRIFKTDYVHKIIVNLMSLSH